ncbi:hypothetical protein Acsp01_42940 [Actinoplanes sp. NBRC 101535]|nr:hypothetical protein Acsp01_42940 [Actinoplanes sp. NBRC 101535]
MILEQNYAVMDADGSPAAHDPARLTADLDPARLTAALVPLTRALRSAVRAAEDLPDLPDAQVEIIRVLPRGTVLSSGELAATLGLSRPTISNLLTAMEARDLITRRPSPGNRRHVQVSATEHALDLFARFDRAAAALVTTALAGLDPADRAVLAEARSALAAALPALVRLHQALQHTPRPEDGR